MRFSQLIGFYLLVTTLIFFPIIAKAECAGPDPQLREDLKKMGINVDYDLQSADFDFSFDPTGLLGRGFKGLRAFDAIMEAACDCKEHSTRAAVMACIGSHLDSQLMCDLYDAAGLPDFRNPFAVLGKRSGKVGKPLTKISNEYYGTGSLCDTNGPGQGPTLYCCHNDGHIDGACGAMWNPQSIACVGNPPSGGAVGIAINGLCEHVAECTLADTSPQAYDPVITAQRLSFWAQDLMIAYTDRAFGDEATLCPSDFASLHGCQGFLDLARDNTEPMLSALDAPDMTTTEAAKIAAQRVMFAIPNGMDRYIHISGRTWTDADKTAYLGGVDAQTELSQWMSPCALELLRETMPDTWQLMAVAYPGEGAPDKLPGDGDWQDGCLMGEPPTSISAKLQRRGDALSLNVIVKDPEAGGDAGNTFPLTIRWGTGDISAEGYAHTASNVYQRDFSGTIMPKVISVGYMNDAGYAVETSVNVSNAVRVK